MNNFTQKKSPTKRMNPNKKLMNYSDLEYHYGLKKSTMTKLVMTGKFVNIVKIGNKNFFRIEDVEAWIDAQTIQVGA